MRFALAIPWALQQSQITSYSFLFYFIRTTKFIIVLLCLYFQDVNDLVVNEIQFSGCKPL